MPVQIGARPDSGFDNPLGMLRDCHRRIEKFVGIRCHVAARRASGPLTDEELSAVKAALQYFIEGGRRHNQDEEDSLFPRLRTAHRAHHDIIHRLQSEHHSADELHGTAARLFSAWISHGYLDPEDQASLTSVTQQLKTLYAEHIRVEEDIVFPHAAKVLDSRLLVEIGSEFRQRRTLASS